MIKYRQHIPGFVDTDEPIKEGTVATVAELLALPWITRKEKISGFYRFSVARGSYPTLMVEYDNGREFWVVAHIKGDTSELPDWKPPPKETP